MAPWRHLVAKFATNARGDIWWPNLELMQVATSGGQICNECKGRHLLVKFAMNAKFSLSHEVNFWVRCAPWQCFLLSLLLCKSSLPLALKCVLVFLVQLFICGQMFPVPLIL